MLKAFLVLVSRYYTVLLYFREQINAAHFLYDDDDSAVRHCIHLYRLPCIYRYGVCFQEKFRRVCHV